jgi:hypothetical protein
MLFASQLKTIMLLGVPLLRFDARPVPAPPDTESTLPALPAIGHYYNYGLLAYLSQLPLQTYITNFLECDAVVQFGKQVRQLCIGM